MRRTGDGSDLRVDTIGSLLRPGVLVDAFTQADAGRLDEAALQSIQDEAIEQVIAEQEKRGLPVLTDGEFRRRHFMESFSHVSGFDHGRLAPLGVAVITDEVAAPSGDGAMAHGYLERAAVVEPLRLARNQVLEEFTFAQSRTDRVVKASLINPGRIVEAYDEEASRGVYEDVDEFIAAVVAVQRQMVGGVVDAGCRYVHIDAPGYTAYVDRDSREAMANPDASLERAIGADNAVMQGFDGVTFGLHMCRGNFRGRWAREGAYDDYAEVTERIYTELRHQRLMLEYDSDRAGGFDSLRFVPAGKIAVLGLISTKSQRLETVDDLQPWVEAAARFLPLEQLAISPQCGFGSVLDGNPLDEDTQWRKLEVMMKAADRIWA